MFSLNLFVVSKEKEHKLYSNLVLASTAATTTTTTTTTAKAFTNEPSAISCGFEIELELKYFHLTTTKTTTSTTTTKTSTTTTTKQWNVFLMSKHLSKVHFDGTEAEFIGF